MGGDEVIREVQRLLGEGITQGLEDHGGDFGFYSEQGGSPGRSLSRGGTGSDLGLRGSSPLAVCGEQTVGMRPPGSWPGPAQGSEDGGGGGGCNAIASGEQSDVGASENKGSRMTARFGGTPGGWRSQ